MNRFINFFLLCCKTSEKESTPIEQESVEDVNKKSKNIDSFEEPDKEKLPQNEQEQKSQSGGLKECL